MKYNVSPRLEHLRRKNRYLLQQLETNSELLEKRLKALRQETRTPRPLERVKELASGSPNKRKYDAWRTRNNSKNVASVLGMSRGQQTEGSSDEDFIHVKKHGTNKSHLPKYATPPPANKSGRPALIVSSYKKKKFSYSHGRSPKRHKRLPGSVKRRVYKPCSECYCPGIIVSDDSDVENHSFYTRNTVNHKCSKSCRCKIPQSSKSESKKVEIRHPKRYDRRDLKGKSIADKEFHSLLSARDIINYSPQSVFLRRLRRQSRSVRNMLFKDTATQTKKGCIFHNAGTSDEEEISSEDSIIKQADKLKKYNTRNKAEPLVIAHELESPLREDHPDTVSKKVKVHDCGNQSRVKDLGKYRRMHWFDCHAETPDFYARNPQLAFNHNCVHRFIVNNRYMAEPVLADHEGCSRCEICLLSDPPQPPTAEDCLGHKKTIITLPVLHKEGNSCGFTARQNDEEEEDKKDYREVDYITPSNLYSEAYGGERKTNTDREERGLMTNADQGSEPRLRGGMDTDSHGRPVDIPFVNMKNKSSHSESVKGFVTYDTSLKTVLDSVNAGKTSSKSASSLNRSVERKCLCASHKEQKCPVARLDRVQSHAPKLNKPIVAVTLPHTKAGNKRLGPFPPKSRVFADPVTVGSGPPVHAVRPPAPVNSLALRFQKGVC